MSRSPQTDPPDDPVEALVNECVEGLEAGDSDAVERVCAENPDHATHIREHVEWLTNAGLLETQTFPETLGEFRLVQRIGGGGMGAVFLAQQPSLGREVALKVMRPEHQFFPASRARFQREVEAIAQLSHPGIVPIYTVGEENGVHFYAMERVDGCTIAELLRAVPSNPSASLNGRDLLGAVETILAETIGAPIRPITETPEILKGTWTDICFRIAARVADALGHAHERGIAHRDIKPSNLMLTRDGRVLVLDFGLASSPTSQLTASGARVGSLPYMSPEQIEGTDVDTRTDVYALGVTLYEMLTLREPYAGATSEITLQLIREGSPRSIRRLNTKVPTDAETVCLTAMAADVRRRYQTVQDLGEDLSRVVHREPIRAKRPGPLLRTRRWVQRRPAAAMAIAAAVLVTVALPTALLIQEESAAIDRGQRLAASAHWMIDLIHTGDSGFMDIEARAPRLTLDRVVTRIDSELADEPEVRASLLRAIGSVYEELGFGAESSILSREAEKLCASDGNEHEGLSAACHDLLTSLCIGCGKLAKAEQHARDSEKLWRAAAAGKGTQTLASAIGRLGYVLRLRSKLGEAEEWGRQAVRMHREEKSHGRQLAISLFHLGTTLLTLGNKEAITVMREAMDVLTQLPVAMPKLTLQTQVQLAHVLHKSGELVLARKEFESAVERARAQHDPDDLGLAAMNSCYAQLLKDLGQLPEAKRRVEAAIRVRQRASDPDSPMLADDLSVLGMIQHKSGDHVGARDSYRKALRIERKMHDGPNKNVAILMSNLASVSPDGARFASDAVALHRQLGERNAAFASSLGVHADFLVAANRLGDAENALEEALEILEERYPNAHLLIGSILNGICAIHLEANDVERSLAFAKRAVEVWQHLKPAHSPGTSAALLNLGRAAWLNGDLQSAEKHLTTVRDMRRRASPTGDKSLADVLMRLGRMQAMQGKLADAQLTFEECMAVTRAVCGPNSSLLTEPTIRLSRVLAAQGLLERSEEVAWEALAFQQELATPSQRPVVHMLEFVRNHKTGKGAKEILEKLLVDTRKLYPNSKDLIEEIETRLK